MRVLAKRIFDLAVVLPMVVLLSPVILIIACLVARQLGWPILFKQLRPGQHGRPFLMYKFRTMREAYDSAGRLLPDMERLTPLGVFLRSTSLDELPELINVIRGEMSLVGPRPLLMNYLNRYTPEQARRHEVKPGVTGWAQINGRNAISWEEKFRLDVWYVDNWTVGLDLLILCKTFWKVLRRDGVSASAHATMPEFTGTESP